MRERCLLVLLGFGLFACERVWDLGNSGGLDSAVAAGFRSAGLSAPKARCSMDGRTRSGSCTLEADASDVTKLVAALKLDPVALTSPGTVEPNHVSHFRYGLKGGHAPCAKRAGFSFGEIASIYVSRSRDAHMRSATNSTMEYFAVVQQRGTKAVCIEMSYAYG